MKCRICGNEAKQVFTAKIMGKYEIAYFECPVCDFLQTETPYWLDEAYKLPINLTDTGIIYRNLGYSKLLSAEICALLDPKAKYLDFAGGYGILTRLMRDMGYDFLWDDQFTPNLIARGFEYKPEMGRVAALTVFETFEHFVDPIFEMERMLKIADTIIFSTIVAPTPVPTTDWWYYGLEHGQHVALYRLKSFQYLADKFGLNFYTNGGDFHMFTKQKLVPHVISKQEFHSVISKLPQADAQLVRKVYANPAMTMTLSPKEMAKRMYRHFRYGDFYKLSSEVSAAERQELEKIFAGPGILNSIYASVYNNAEAINHFFAEPELVSKRVSDMEYMQPFVLKFHEASEHKGQ